MSLEKASRVKCLEPNPPGDFYTLYQPIFVAEGGDVTLDGVDALGPGVKITGSEAVLLPADADPATESPGVSLGEDWPLTLGARERAAFDLPTRAPLEGFVVPEGRYVMPFLRFRATERGQFAAAVVTYDAGDASGQASGRIGTKIDPTCD